ncbi:MAG: hypothetical protein KGL43_04715, partial [Burkholderiales bacterium]|nr:hypothetical protein [Burkholderiales bacterium]
LGQSGEQANALRLLGRARSQAGQADAAADALAQALAIDRRLGLPQRIGLDLGAAAENERGRGRIDAARDFYERAATVYEASGDLDAARLMRERSASAASAAAPR